MTKKAQVEVGIMVILLLLVMMFVALTLSQTGGVNVYKKQYDNPRDCQDEVKIDVDSQIMAQQMSASPNCFSWGGDGENWYVKCCQDEGVKYQN